MPDDIARVALWLVSNESPFVNGHDWVVDGGLIGRRLWSPQQEALRHLRAAGAASGDHWPELEVRLGAAGRVGAAPACSRRLPRVVE